MPGVADAETTDARAAPSGLEYDAFLSYSSGDLRAARRIQIFLEKYRSRALGRRLKVFLDRTDLRGGELSDAIRGALRTSGALIVCASPGAAESRWVTQEIRTFRELHGEERVALVVVAGTSGLLTLEALREVDCRRHDVRRGWFAGILRPGARLEMLRLLAFVSGVDLRSLRNWHLRRTARNVAIGIAAAALLPILLLSVPMDHWDPIPLQAHNGPLYAIAAEANDGKLWTAARFRAPGPQGFRNYIRVTADAFDPKAREDFSGQIRLRRKLLPVTTWPYSDKQRLPSLPPPPSGRPFVETQAPFAAEVHPGRFVIVRAVGMTDEEALDADLLAIDMGLSAAATKVHGSLVLVADEEGVRTAEIDGMTPNWKDRGAGGEPTSPSRGLPVAWAPDGQIWLGLPGWDAEASGGLWHTADRGRSWTKVDGFAGVTSIALRETGTGSAVTVAESHFDRWRGSFLEPYASRVVVRQPGATAWQAAPMPPFGTRSDIELTGVLNGAEIVRVDERLYRRERQALWRFLLERTR